MTCLALYTSSGAPRYLLSLCRRRLHLSLVLPRRGRSHRRRDCGVPMCPAMSNKIRQLLRSACARRDMPHGSEKSVDIWTYLTRRGGYVAKMD